MSPATENCIESWDHQFFLHTSFHLLESNEKYMRKCWREMRARVRNTRLRQSRSLLGVRQ